MRLLYDEKRQNFNLCPRFVLTWCMRFQVSQRSLYRPRFGNGMDRLKTAPVERYREFRQLLRPPVWQAGSGPRFRIDAVSVRTIENAQAVEFMPASANPEYELT